MPGVPRLSGAQFLSSFRRARLHHTSASQLSISTRLTSCFSFNPRKAGLCAPLKSPSTHPNTSCSDLKTR